LKNKKRLRIHFNLAGKVGHIYIRCEQVSPELALDDSRSLLARSDDITLDCHIVDSISFDRLL
jgi:hypothetical protein